MSDAVLVAIITALPALCAAIVGIVNHFAIHDVHVSLNSRLSELIAASVSKGRIAERQDQRDTEEGKALDR